MEDAVMMKEFKKLNKKLDEILKKLKPDDGNDDKSKLKPSIRTKSLFDLPVKKNSK
ncbi:MAG: hypothetical protein K9M99_02840 [Candidatus Cloacimonetes bacterium]|nr:hypothetical protein [Candidatus Cloacimonadota bacterium]